MHVVARWQPAVPGTTGAPVTLQCNLGLVSFLRGVHDGLDVGKGVVDVPAGLCACGATRIYRPGKAVRVRQVRVEGLGFKVV